MQSLDLPYCRDACRVFERLLSLPYPVLLHSAAQRDARARYDIMAADPRWTTHAHPSDRTPLNALRAALREQPVRQRDGAEPPFRSGWLGTFGYGLHAALERLPMPPADPTRWPQLHGGWYAWSIVTDHGTRMMQLHLDDSVSGRERREILNRLCTGRSITPSSSRLRSYQSTTSPERYRKSFAEVKERIVAGDCYQINLARHFRAGWRSGTPRDLVAAAWHVYRSLCSIQPGPFSAFFGAPSGAVVSFSPERLLRIAGSRIVTSPIKGTAPRGANAAEDTRARLALAASAKNRAENLMIVDLLRNDLGRICVPGSIRVEALFDVLTLSNVHHLVSTIEGDLGAGVSVLDAMAAAFPSGSITGAPKIQAMRIIDALEPVGRSVYCGALGYIDASGDADFNVAIRTLVVDADAVHCWGGGGIVADSDCDDELAEIDYKVGRLLRALA